MRLRRVHCSPARDKDSVYRILGTGGEGGLHTKHRCETDEFPEIAPSELLPAGTRKALNAWVPAEGRAGEIGRLPRFARNDMLPRAACPERSRTGSRLSDLRRKTRVRMG